MKLMILNYSGNVGKSTIAKYLLAPRLENCKIYPVESINENDHTESNIRGTALGKIIDDMMAHDNVLLDVGSSNAETVVSLLAKYEGSHEDFDGFILPVISKPKVIADTMQTALALLELGVDASKVIVILNQVDIETDIDLEFKELQSQNGLTLTFDKELAIPMHDFFTRIANTGFDFLEILQDDVDYAKLIKETEKGSPELADYITRRALKRLANNLEKTFSMVFDNVQKKLEA